MMTRLYSSTVLGVDGVEVEVEVDFRPMAEKRRYFEKEGDDNKITEIIAVKTLTRRNNSVGWYC